MKLRHDVRGLSHRIDHVVGEHRWVRRCEADAFETFDLTASAQQFGERLAVAEFNAVGVHVLPEQGYFDRAVVDECLHFGEDLARAAVFFFSA